LFKLRTIDDENPRKKLIVKLKIIYTGYAYIVIKTICTSVLQYKLNLVKINLSF